jgi:fatty acid desaturase
MSNDSSAQKINWYRTPIDRETLAALNQRSDVKGFAQTLGHLGIICCTGAFAWYAAYNLPWYVLVFALILHGTVYAFLLNGFHELCHGTVFKSKWLNTFFLYVVSFLGGYNPIMFWTSHQEHHKYTLHPPDDLEVVLPYKITLEGFLKYSFINPWGVRDRIKDLVRLSRGRLEGEWEHILFPEREPHKRQRLFLWARILLFGHALLIAVSIVLGWWMLPVLITFAPFYASCLLFLCNNTQHVGLQDNAPDYRLCTRTFRINPVVQFLYWHMNYHIEHHMYAAVPCYNLGKLHEAIKHDLPHTPVGLVETWRGIIAILRRQQAEPTYEFVPELPSRAAASPT